jgi:hypothetical protein
MIETTPEARKQTPPAQKQGGVWKIVLFMAIAFVMLLIFGHTSDQQQGSSTPSSVSRISAIALTPEDGSKTLRGTCWCGERFDDAMEIGMAVNRGDTAAVFGLLTRGKAFQVEGGTKVFSAGEDMGISTVLVKSGLQTGRKCYISTNALE